MAARNAWPTAASMATPPIRRCRRFLAVDQVAGAGAVVAGGVVVPPVVVDGEFAAAGPAGGQALQQGAALPDGAGPGLVRDRPDVPADPLLVGQVVVPVQEPLVVVGDEHLPVVPAEPAPPGPQITVRGDVLLGAGAAVDVGAGVGRVGERGVHRMVRGFHPDHLRGRRCRTGSGLQRPFQLLFPQPQPGPADGPARGEPGEHRGDDPGDRLVRVQQDLPLVLAPDQPDRQAAAQFPALGLVPYPAVQPGPQHVQFGFRHGSLQAQQHPVVEQPRMVDAVGVGEQRVRHPGQVQQPVPIGVVPGEPGNLQRQNDSHLTQTDQGGQLGEPGTTRRARAAAAQIGVDDPHRVRGPAHRTARSRSAYCRSVDSVLCST